MDHRTLLVIQCLRLHLANAGAQVQSLVQEDSTWHRANKPMHHNYSCVYNYRVCSLEPKSHHD